MSLKLTILGFHSATPRLNALPTSQILEVNNQLFLIDCGEGTQMQLRKHHISFGKINHVFISHLHGDHFFGLIGLISSFGLLNRTKTLHIHGPKGIKQIIELQLTISQSHLSFPLVFNELENNESELIWEDKDIEVRTIPLNHRIYTNGFLFLEKPGLLNLDMDSILKEPEIERCDYFNIKKGKNFIRKNGTEIPNLNLTLPPKKTASYAFCSDTSYHPHIIPLIKDVDLLYHEATFTKEHETLAYTTGHAFAEQAGKIAKKAKVKKLILGHFSSRYANYNEHLKEAKQVFENTFIAEEGLTLEI